jgi:hypothetical protein
MSTESEAEKSDNEKLAHAIVDGVNAACAGERERLRREFLAYVDDLSARNAVEANAVERAVAKIFGSIVR